MSYTITTRDWVASDNERTRLDGSTIFSDSWNRSAAGSRSGESVPGYRAMLRAGNNASSPYALDRSKLVRFELGGISYTSKPYTGGPLTVIDWQGVISNQRPNLPSHLPVDASKSDSIALQKAYAKIRYEQQHLNALASAAEFGDVIRQFGAPFASIIDLTNRRLNRLALERRGLRGTTIFKRIKWAEIVASTYLEYSFGLAPLIDDAKKAAEAYARFVSETEGRDLFRSRVRARGLDEAITVASGTASATSTKAFYNTAVKTQTEVRTQYVVGLSSNPIAPVGDMDRMLQLLGITPENLIPAVYEAVPWSWLIDYFANVGQILNAISTVTTGVKWISKTVTYKTTVTKDSAFVPDVFASRFNRSVNDQLVSFDIPLGMGHAGRSIVVRTTMTRSVPVSLGIPSLQFTFPGDWQRLSNMAAVLLARRPSSSALWLF